MFRKPAERSLPFILPEGASLRGDLVFPDGHVRIEGEVIGLVHARCVEIGPAGRVCGNVKADSVDIEGIVQDQSGSPDVSVHAVTIRVGEKARISGKVIYDQISIASGAKLFLTYLGPPTGNIADQDFLPAPAASDSASRNEASTS